MADKKRFIVKGKVWVYPGLGGWHFVYVDKKFSEKLKKEKTTNRVGFSFVKIKARLGKTEWNTSLFPTKEGPYLLSIKASVRKKEAVYDGDDVTVRCIFQ